ncbi:MAG: hypothetical protein GXY06_01035 [Clostridiaceae bacterium]|nr:hypothetical protein [Clostridiaceae bacterium]
MRIKLNAIAVIFVVSLMLSLSACGKKPITAEKYQKVMTDAGLTVEVGEDMQEGVESYYLASDLTRLSYLEFYESKDAAKEKFDDALKDMKDMEAEINASADGVAANFKVETSESSGVNKLTASMGSEDAGYGYDKVVIIQVDNMLILVHAFSEGEGGTKLVDDLVEKLGY